MDDSTEQVRDEFIQLWSRLGQFWGISAGTSRVYAWLLSRPDGAGSEAIMAGLGMSRGAVSMACKELRDWGLVITVQDPGERRGRHVVETDLVTVVRNIVRARKRREWDPILDGVRDWIPRLASDVRKRAGCCAQRLDRSRPASPWPTHGAAFLDCGMLSDLGLRTITATARRHRRGRKT